MPATALAAVAPVLQEFFSENHVAVFDVEIDAFQ